MFRFFEFGRAENWSNWQGPSLAKGINNMANSFLSQLIQRHAIPDDTMTIAYIALAQGGLGLMDATSRAIPDLYLR